jgi:hypothetical protein
VHVIEGHIYDYHIAKLFNNEISVGHGDEHEDYHLVGYDVTQCSIEEIWWISYKPAASIFMIQT